MRLSRPFRLASFPLASIALAAAPALFAQQVRTGKIAQSYQELCANCHGKNLEGGRAPSGRPAPTLLDHEWLHGGDDESIAKSIRDGNPLNEMPAWGASVPEKEIRAMVIYLREQQNLARRGQLTFTKPADNMSAKSELHSFRIATWVGDLREPYGLAFLPGDRAVVTEKRGAVYLIENGARAKEPLRGMPEVDTGGQAGLFDVVPHPNYAENGWLYFAFSDPQNRGGQNVSLTRIIRGKIRDGALVEQQTIFQAPVEMYPRAGGVHFGGRIAFDRAGYLFFTIGERGKGPNAQDLRVVMGKVHRIHDDGRVPEDNPLRKNAGAFPTIWSYGHRNPQGLAFHPATGELYDLEHGPRGGDEVNLVRPGRNFGWPVITHGMDYNGTAITDLTAKEGMEQPVTYWVPSIAPCGANFYSGDLFPKWKNHLFVATLAAQELRRLELRGDQLIKQEILFKDLGRIRHVIGGPDGALYVLLERRIARITPAE